MGRLWIASTALCAAGLLIGSATTEVRAASTSEVVGACAQSDTACLAKVDDVLASARQECERISPQNPEDCLCDDDDIRRLTDATVIVNNTNPALAGQMSRRVVAEAGRCLAITAETDEPDHFGDPGSQN